ncbi:MAG: GntP family permease, partial [Novipirellula sp. JB048]
MTRLLHPSPFLLLIALAFCFGSHGLFSSAAISQVASTLPDVVSGESLSAATDSELAAPLIPTPVIILVVGIVSVLGMIIGLKLNAFLALILSALIISLLVGLSEEGSATASMDAVVSAFGSSAGSIGIVIAMAAIIGKCMLDSGAADRIVRSAVRVTGEKKASLGLMVSGFVLAVPVFFDTVFYLLVPLARSLHRRTNKNYLRYLMAIATGGAITHTLVPPTPGPLLVSSILGVE